MNPYEIGGTEERREGACESLIDPPVADIVRPRKIGEAYPVMHRRPKRPIVEAVIVLLAIQLRQIDDGVLHSFGVDYRGLQGGLGSHPAAPTKPEPLIVLKGLAQSDR